MKRPAPTRFESKLARAVASLSKNRRYLIGVSGGRDSIALLDGLMRLGFTRLIVCHLNHGLRGRAAAADANFVAGVAKKHGLEFELEKADTRRLASSRSESIETAARHARYEFFARAAQKHRCRSIFLAHHADDQVEKFLFNLFRGSGISGLGGMSEAAERTIGRTKLQLLRPMLGIWREEIDEYIATQELRYREDASNAETEHTRNRIRHKLLPDVEELFGKRNVRPSLWRLMEILRAEDEWISTLAGAETASELDVASLCNQPVEQQRRRLLSWLRNQGVPDIGFEAVELVRGLLTNAEPAKVNLPGNWHARRRAKKLFLEQSAGR